MKKFLVILVIAAMLLTLFGCSAVKETPTDQTQPTNGEEPVEDTPEDKYKEHYTFTFASVQIKAGTDYNADKLSRYFLDKFNMEWEIISLTWDNWAEKMRIWINADDMPDLATWNYVHGEALAYAEQGLIRRFPDDWKTRWPHVAKAYENSQLGPAVEGIFGGTYFLPKPIFSQNKPTDPLVGHQSLIMRKDWLEAVGAEIKDAYKASEVNEIARKIKEQDPGNLGPNLLPINVRYSNIYGVYIASNNAWLSDQFAKDENGKYVWGPAQPNVLVGLRLYQEAFREGLLNPEFFTLTGDEDKASFYAAGQTGITVSEGMATFFLQFEQEMQKNLNLDADKSLHIAHIIGEDGRYHQEEIINFWTASIFSPNMEESKFERLMDLFDYVATEEGQLKVRLGFEGIDYTVEPDGSFNVLWEEGQQITDIYPSAHPVYGNMVILTDDFAIVNPGLPEKFRNRTLEMYHSKEALSDETSVPRRDWTVFLHDSPNRRRLRVNLAEQFAQLITMDGDLEANWSKWVEDNMPLVNPVLEELNALQR